MNGDILEIFYGKNVPTFSNYIVQNLTTSLPYRFRIQAENFNQLGPLSNVATIWTCDPPSAFSPPTFVASTSVSMTIAWQAPKITGGCPITGYAVFRDDGVTGDPTIEVNSNNDPLIRDIPTLRQATATLSNSLLGSNIKYKVRVFNSIADFVDSESVCFTFSTIPEAPSLAPVVN